MDKFTKLQNEMLETMYEANLTKSQYKALLYIIRKTVGWNKSKDYISITKLARDTRQSKQSAIDAVHGLEEQGIITVERYAGHPGRIMLEPVKKWIPVLKSRPVKKTVPQGVRKSRPQAVKKTVPTKDTLKDNILNTCAPTEPNPWDDVITDEEAEEWANT